MLRVPPRARAHRVERLVHGREDGRVLAHAEVVVAAPHGDGLRGPVRPVPGGVGELAALARDVDEGAVAALVVEAVEGGVEGGVVAAVQGSSFRRAALGPLVT
jgi:acetylornithine/succinyldiaminopimelate/putrescine aminotransferase